MRKRVIVLGLSVSQSVCHSTMDLKDSGLSTEKGIKLLHWTILVFFKIAIIFVFSLFFQKSQSFLAVQSEVIMGHTYFIMYTLRTAIAYGIFVHSYCALPIGLVTFLNHLSSCYPTPFLSSALSSLSHRFSSPLSILLLSLSLHVLLSMIVDLGFVNFLPFLKLSNFTCLIATIVVVSLIAFISITFY